MQSTDTIAAIATAAGMGGIGIVRLSGPRARSIGEMLCGVTLIPRHARHVVFRDELEGVIDDGIALSFPGPRSYTGEDVVELQAHGNPILLQRLLRRCFALGARASQPGEFTERAYRNQKLDLTQAEAIADLIAATSEAAATAARRSLDGAFSRRLETLLAALTGVRVLVEAAIDFSEEEIEFLADVALLSRLDEVRAAHATLIAEATRGQRLRDGLHVVIVGPPNAGKSCLLNALIGSDRAIVTAEPGTTRDLLRETVRVDGIELTLVDTAGLRESADSVEQEGIRRAKAELALADLVLAVVDAADLSSARHVLTSELADAPAILWLHNKVDLLDHPLPQLDAESLWISARDGFGLDTLRQRLMAAAGVGSEGTEGAFSARARHVEALRRVGVHLDTAANRLCIDRAGDLAAEDLRLAQDALGELTGATRSDDLLGAIFASFCIGK